MGDEVSKFGGCSKFRLAAIVLGDNSDDVGNLGGLDSPPSEDPSLLEFSEILKNQFETL